MFVQENRFKRKLKSACLLLFNYLENNNRVVFEENGESLFVENIMRYLQRHQQNRVTFFDVGANVGDYTDILLNMSIHFNLSPQVFSFEPTAMSYQSICSRFRTNNHVRVINAAASDTKGKSAIYFDQEGSKLASLYPRNLDMYDIDMRMKEGIETIRLDTLIPREHIEHIHLLKLDVEGHERSVLSGLGEFLRPDFIDFIQFEYGGANLDSHTSLMDLYAVFEQAGFIVAKIMPKGLAVRSYHPYMENYQYSNYAAISPSVMDERNS